MLSFSQIEITCTCGKVIETELDSFEYECPDCKAEIKISYVSNDGVNALISSNGTVREVNFL